MENAEFEDAVTDAIDEAVTPIIGAVLGDASGDIMPDEKQAWDNACRTLARIMIAMRERNRE